MLKVIEIFESVQGEGNKAYLGSGKYLNHAIRKYGKENFVRIDIDEFNSIEEGCCKERVWIQTLDSKFPKGYNLNDGGGGQFNPSDEIRRKIRESISGDNHPMRRDVNLAKRHGQKLLGKPSGFKGRHHSKETWMQMSRIHTGKYQSQETKDKLSRLNCGQNNPIFGRRRVPK